MSVFNLNVYNFTSVTQNFNVNLSEHELEAAAKLASMRTDSSYEPARGLKAKKEIRAQAPYAKENQFPATKLTSELFSRFYPINSKVRYQKIDYKIAGNPENGKVQIENRRGEKSTVSISALKPVLVNGEYVLALDPKDDFKRHAVVKIESQDRGNVVGEWIEFGGSKYSDMIQKADALFRMIPISSPADVSDLVGEVIPYEVDGQLVGQGTVYTLAGR